MTTKEIGSESNNRRPIHGSIGEVVSATVSFPTLGSFLFGFLAATLLLSTGTITAVTSAVGFFWALVALLLFTLLARWRTGKQADRKHRWGLVTLLVLGFGLGSLLHHYKEWARWLWTSYRRINEPWELIMEGLFLFGVILGFFVVRNWSKEQKDFLGSLTAVLGGAVISTALGPLTKSVDSVESFAYYFLGFTMSGSLNLIGASWLMANYSNKPSVTNRALLDFLYGADKAEAIDKQFLKNFERDPIYARRLLVEALDNYKEKVLREFAHKMESKRNGQRHLKYYLLTSIEGPVKRPAEKSDEHLQTLEHKGTKVDPEEKAFTVNIRKLGDQEQISPDMFRMSISVKYQEYLEYIGSDTGGWKSFPLLGSVAGLALLAGQTVVMDRDKNTRFRTREHLDGICPVDVEQQRGLDEISYLSYISIPVVTELGNYRETPLGIISVSTKLFAVPHEENETATDGKEGTYRVKARLSALTDMAKLIYDQKDESVSYLEDMRTVAVPLLELYLRCRQGAT